MHDNGTLYIVPTPIGNMQDITHRAISILNTVDLIACEDTRHSQRLLQHYQITTPLTSLHEHNEDKRAAFLADKLKQGDNIALISDAGTPLISDPGYTLVNTCRAQGVTVTALPGPCAAITALSASGLATDRFTFEGFLPVKQQAKTEKLSQLTNESSTSVFYEAPRRVKDTLLMIKEVLGSERQIVLAKELSKAFENYVSGNADTILEWLDSDPAHQKGEFVLLVSGIKKGGSDIPEEAINLLKQLKNELPLKKAAAITANHYDLKKNELYQLGLTFD
ncbi:16S rRNA (cytidine(1402)-2'-O)-methyltransferase [Alteromonadaceae bacterium M269]|nr:16S rRNA (cytidine(1402)-2'-O)-methyltransferase [Alteromonadaceae bacterium M269]